MADLGRPLRRFLAQRRARAGLWILGILAVLAAWAPFVANDKPFVLVAADVGAAERARMELVPLAESTARAFDDDSHPGAKVREREVAALRERVDRLALAAGSQRLDFLVSRIENLSPGDQAALQALVAAARDAQRDLADATLSPPVERAFPLLAALGPDEVAFALLPISVLTAWLLRRRLRARGAWSVALVPPLLLALVVALFVPSPALRAPGAIKQDIAREKLQVERVLFAPIAMGYAESNLGEAWRPPTWLAHSEMDAEGRYSSGPRAGGSPAGRPDVRPGEPALDHPARHVLGTDALGRDIAARCLWGGRVSLAIGFAAAALLTAIGTLVGAAAGFLGRRVDAVLSRTIEIVLCFPAFFLVLCAIAWTDPDVVPVPLAVVLVIAAVGWTGTARLVRAEALRVASLEHVLAARALGLAPFRILVRHVLPNAMGPALVAFGFAAGGAIAVESSLAFLGLGVQVPVPSWGGLVGEARNMDQAWAWIVPGALVFLAVLAWILVAEAAREALEPRAAEHTQPAHDADHVTAEIQVHA
jgi:peptide/nickel transport system permease protein